MNPRLRRSAAHVFVESLDSPVLSVDDEHHLRRVLRIKPGDVISVSDGRGAWAPASWSLADGITIMGDVERLPAGRPTCIASAIPKGDRPDWIVQKLTELGIDRVVFFESVRSVVRWDDARSAKQLDRLRRVAREAAMQSRRVVLPSVELLAWHDVLALAGLAAADPGGGALDHDVHAVAIGPEGGFTDDELAAAGRTVRLSTLVLRVETAAVAAAVRVADHHATSSP